MLLAFCRNINPGESGERDDTQIELTANIPVGPSSFDFTRSTAIKENMLEK
jgi:hypothetical protein